MTQGNLFGDLEKRTEVETPVEQPPEEAVETPQKEIIVPENAEQLLLYKEPVLIRVLPEKRLTVKNLAVRCLDEKLLIGRNIKDRSKKMAMMEKYICEHDKNSRGYALIMEEDVAGYVNFLLHFYYGVEFMDVTTELAFLAPKHKSFGKEFLTMCEERRREIYTEVKRGNRRRFGFRRRPLRGVNGI